MTPGTSEFKAMACCCVAMAHVVTCLLRKAGEGIKLGHGRAQLSVDILVVSKSACEYGGKDRPAPD